MDLGPGRLSLPDERFVFEMTDKGFSPACVTLDGQAFDLMFFDPVRAGQELHDLELRTGVNLERPNSERAALPWVCTTKPLCSRTSK